MNVDAYMAAYPDDPTVKAYRRALGRLRAAATEPVSRNVIAINLTVPGHDDRAPIAIKIPMAWDAIATIRDVRDIVDNALARLGVTVTPELLELVQIRFEVS